MHYLLTGGAGFIGSHLAERLLKDGHSLTILDDFSTGREANIAHLRSNPKLDLIRDTVENEQTAALVVSRADAIFHLAAAVGVKLVAEEPVRTIRTTIHGTEVILDAAHRFGKPVLITSSSEVYGKGTRVPFREEDDVLMGATKFSRWCYAYSKGIDEFLGLAYHKQFGLPVTLVRLFNTVGPRQVGMYGMVLPRFTAAALANQPLEVYGDGNQTRCFSHVSDVVDALIKLMNTPKAVGDVFNLGGHEEISINDLARRVISLANSKSEIKHIPYEQAYGRAFDDLPRRVPDLTKIKNTIGFAPKHNLDQIIQSVLYDQKRHP
ncbi:MAG TPA: GDP-mannose 4,6-dehydratase [Tepidisphaeraceae bacterium]|jgi:UDP-glucose 4-epimerase|nr:GDP-mannose 4,6-dehydratase [Tepidisphaeraceae bacterium]